MYRIISLLNVVFCFTTITMNAQWLASPSLQHNSETTIFTFASHNDYLIAGFSVQNFLLADSIVFRSTDNGDSWENISAGLHPAVVTDLVFVEDTLFIGLSDIAGQRNMYRAEDYGDTWERIISPVDFGVVFELEVYQNMMVASTDPGGLIYSHDAGRSWNQVSPFRLITSFARIDSVFYGSAPDGIYASFDGGETWVLKESNGIPEFIDGRKVNAKLFASGDTLYTSGAFLSNGGMYVSYDKGDNWNLLSPDLLNVYPQTFVKQHNHFFVGTVHISQNDTTSGIFYSDDFGISWNKNPFSGLPRFPSVSSNHIYALYARNGRIFTGVYGKGLYYLSIDSITTNVSEHMNPVNKFDLVQNYPNPFNPSTTIEYSIPVVDALSEAEVQNVTLKVYDILGNEVATLVNEEKSPGNYRTLFDAGKLSAGVYIYTLKQNTYSQSKKLILLK